MIIIYNIKIYRYPSGTHIRIYSRLVGYYDNDKDIPNMATALCMDYEAGEYVEERYNPQKQCVEPFSENIATLIVDKEKDYERSIRNSMHRTINRVYHISRSNVWEWFVTLTFNPDKVDSFEYLECVKNLKIWIDGVRRICPDIQYIIVPELHKSGRYHFHGLLAHCDNIVFTDSGYKTKNGQPIYNVGNYKLGYSTATKIVDNERATKYITKYITKDMCCVAFGKKRYWASRNLADCKAEEYIVEGSKLPVIIADIESKCKYKKDVVTLDLKTTYYEMG